jgi:GxxExxY protein
MMIELRKLGLECKRQYPIEVFYEGENVGDYFADIIVEDKVIVELKAAKKTMPRHEAQLVNYLRATNIEVGLLINFGKKADHKRRVLTEEYKNHKKSL